MSLGGLVVSLGLDAIDYTQGLTKAEHDAQKFAQNVNRAMLQVGKVLGGLEIGREIFNATKEIISSAAALQDLAGVTGSSVESLSKLSNQAKISGADFKTLEHALEQLSVRIGGNSKEAERAQKAMRLLGVSATDPVQALNDVAVAFSKYEDGARKVAFAQAIFGKSGADFLKTLQDIAETQDVAATVTAKQAEEAKKLEASLRALSVEASTFRDIVLSGIVPALNRMIQEFLEGTKAAGGLLNAILIFGTMSPFDSTVEGLKKVQKQIDDIEAHQAKGGTKLGAPGAFGSADESLKRLRAEKEILQLRQRQEALALISDANQDARDLKAKQRAILPPLPDPNKGRAAVDRTPKLLLDQALKDLDLAIAAERDTLSARESFLRLYYQNDLIGLRDFYQGRRDARAEALDNETAALNEEISLLQSFAAKAKPEARIQAEIKLAEVIAKRNKVQQQAAQDSATAFIEEDAAIRKITETVNNAATALKALQGDTVGAGLNAFDAAHRRLQTDLQQLQKSPIASDQALAGQGLAVIDQTRQLTENRLKLDKATKDYSLTLDELAIAQQRIDIAQQTGDLTTLGGLQAKSELAAKYTVILKEQLAVAQALAAESGKREDIIRVQQLQVQLESLAATGDLVAKQFNQIFVGAFTDAIEQAVSGTKKLKDVFLDMAKNIERAITRIAAQNIAEKLFGTSTSGDSGIDWGKILSSIFSAISGPSPAAPGLASGTDFWRGGPTVVGESGPEVVNLPRGATVTSNKEVQKTFGPSMNFVVNVLPGASTKTAQQAAAMTGIQVQRALARNT